MIFILASFSRNPLRIGILIYFRKLSNMTLQIFNFSLDLSKNFLQFPFPRLRRLDRSHPLIVILPNRADNIRNLLGPRLLSMQLLHRGQLELVLGGLLLAKSTAAGLALLLQRQAAGLQALQLGEQALVLVGEVVPGVLLEAVPEGAAVPLEVGQLQPLPLDVRVQQGPLPLGLAGLLQGQPQPGQRGVRLRQLLLLLLVVHPQLLDVLALAAQAGHRLLVLLQVQQTGLLQALSRAVTRHHALVEAYPAALSHYE
jgi:hypothetical protein